MKSDSEWVTGQIKISIGGVPLEMQMTVPAKPVKPQRMLPIFQQMSNSFVEMGINAVENEGGKVSCQKGCTACCYQLIPLAEIEAYRIAELVENLPEPRRSEIKKRFDEACRHFYEINWFERLDKSACLSNEDREKVVLEYFYEGVGCPFLENGECSIYEERPLSCREYLVTSPAENCSAPSPETIRMVEFPIKSATTLRHIGNSQNLNRIVNFLPLILALKWAETYPDKFPEKTGEQWMADFFQKLTNSSIPKEKNI
jgi:Fe-S-cluster containining protein